MGPGGNSTDNTKLNDHINDTVVHLTDEDRAKLDKIIAFIDNFENYPAATITKKDVDTWNNNISRFELNAKINDVVNILDLHRNNFEIHTNLVERASNSDKYTTLEVDTIVEQLKAYIDQKIASLK